MTYNVFGGTLNLAHLSIYLGLPNISILLMVHYYVFSCGHSIELISSVKYLYC